MYQRDRTGAESHPRQSTQSVDVAPEAPPVRRGAVFGIIVFALMMMSIDGTIVATALPALRDGLNTTVNWAGWTITGYSFGFVLMLPISGRLGERYGHRRMFLASVGAFTIASLLCGLVHSIYLLIACRALQAAGGAGFTPSATGIVVDHFGPARDRAVSLFGSIFPIGMMIGPIFGGLFVTYWSWRGIFLVNVPIGILVIAVAWHFIPHDKRHANAKLPMDMAGMGWLGVGLIASMFAASYLGEADASVASPVFFLPVLVAVATFTGFVRHIRRAKQPFITPELIYGNHFGAVNIVNILFGGVTSGAAALIPLYAVNRYGISELHSGTLLVAQGVASIILATLATWAIRRTGYRMPVAVGAVAVAAGMLELAPGPMAGISPYLWLAAGAFLIGIGTGIMSPATRSAGLQLAPQRSSTLAALRSMSRQVGSISTITIVTAIVAGSSRPGIAQAGIYVAVAIVMIIALPIVTRMPEHRGAW